MDIDKSGDGGSKDALLIINKMMMDVRKRGTGTGVFQIVVCTVQYDTIGLP